VAGFGFGQRWETNGSWVVSLLPTTGRVERESIMSGGIWRIWDGMGVALGEEIRQIKRPHPKTQSGLDVGKSGSAPSWTLGWPLLLVVDMLGGLLVVRGRCSSWIIPMAEAPRGIFRGAFCFYFF
jgi:hypothetical protein